MRKKKPAKHVTDSAGRRHYTPPGLNVIADPVGRDARGGEVRMKYVLGDDYPERSGRRAHDRRDTACRGRPRPDGKT